MPHRDRRRPGASFAAGDRAGRSGLSHSLIRAWRLGEARYAGDLSELAGLGSKVFAPMAGMPSRMIRRVLDGAATGAIWAAAWPGSAIPGGAPGTVQARSTSGLISFREMPGCLFRGVIFLWLSQQAERKRTRPSSTTPRSKAEIDQVTPDFSASPKRGVRSPRSQP